MEKKHFIVTTNGNTASKWLAAALSMHPDILCSHGTLRIPLCLRFEREYTAEEFRLALDDETRRSLPLDSLFAELYPEKDAHVYGNVHMFNLRNLRTNVKQHPPAVEFLVVDLVRHPISSIASGAANLEYQSSINPGRQAYLRSIYQINRQRYDRLAQRFRLNLADMSTLAFMASAMTIKSLALNLCIQELDKRITMESVTTNRTCFKELVEFVSQGSVSADDGYIEQVFRIGRVNRHNMADPNLTLKEQVAAWDEWKQVMVVELLLESGLHDQYHALGYDFGFLHL